MNDGTDMFSDSNRRHRLVYYDLGRACWDGCPTESPNENSGNLCRRRDS